jgi:hypothetical protein
VQLVLGLEPMRDANTVYCSSVRSMVAASSAEGQGTTHL